MTADATALLAIRGNCLFHAQTKRGEAVVFARQGHAQDMIVIAVYENGKPDLERRISCWAYEAGVLADGLRELRKLAA